MPEGVEVKLSAELIRPLVVGKVVSGLAGKGRYKDTDPEGMDEFSRDSFGLFDNEPPATVLDVRTKGKFMYWTFGNGWYMFCTFGMTGQWSPKQGKHPSFIIYFKGDVDNPIVFNDPRHFGTIKFVKGEDKLRKKLYELGWDPLTQDWEKQKPFVTGTVISAHKPIGQLLMDQKVFAGVGNYIRAEALYEAKISPWRHGSALSKEEVENLCKALVSVMNESYSHQGATIHTYATVYGEEGKYSSCFKVYGQKNDPLGNPIIKEETPEVRTIHWCPAVQS